MLFNRETCEVLRDEVCVESLSLEFLDLNLSTATPRDQYHRIGAINCSSLPTSQGGGDDSEGCSLIAFPRSTQNKQGLLAAVQCIVRDACLPVIGGLNSRK